MPVEIRELIIRAVVDARQTAAASDTAAETDREALIQACVEEMGLVNLFSSPETVHDRIQHFLTIAYRSQSPTHEPSFLSVTWGEINFLCRLTSVTINYTSFDRKGAALRAELDITLTSDEEIKKQQARLSFASPDVSHARLVRGGDTLPLMTQAV